MDGIRKNIITVTPYLEVGMKILNMTSHEINIISEESVTFNPDIRKYISESPEVLETIPLSGMLNVVFESSAGDPIGKIPTRVKRIMSADPVPDADVIIVSALYVGAVKDDRLYTVIDPVFMPDGRTVIGCLAIGQIEL